MGKKRQNLVDDTIGRLVGGEKPGRKKSAGGLDNYSVKLAPEDIQSLEQIADELGVSRHNLMQYAIRDLIRRWQRGERPTPTQEIKVRLK